MTLFLTILIIVFGTSDDKTEIFEKNFSLIKFNFSLRGHVSHSNLFKYDLLDISDKLSLIK